MELQPTGGHAVTAQTEVNVSMVAALVNNYPSITIHQLSSALDLLYCSIQGVLTDNMWRRCCTWMPHRLTMALQLANWNLQWVAGIPCWKYLVFWKGDNMRRNLSVPLRPTEKARVLLTVEEPYRCVYQKSSPAKINGEGSGDRIGFRSDFKRISCNCWQNFAFLSIFNC